MRAGTPAHAAARTGTPLGRTAEYDFPAERAFPVPVVAGHGLLAWRYPHPGAAHRASALTGSPPGGACAGPAGHLAVAGRHPRCPPARYRPRHRPGQAAAAACGQVRGTAEKPGEAPGP